MYRVGQRRSGSLPPRLPRDAASARFPVVNRPVWSAIACLQSCGDEGLTNAFSKICNLLVSGQTLSDTEADNECNLNVSLILAMVYNIEGCRDILCKTSDAEDDIIGFYIPDGVAEDIVKLPQPIQYSITPNSSRSRTSSPVTTQGSLRVSSVGSGSSPAMSPY